MGRAIRLGISWINKSEFKSGATAIVVGETMGEASTLSPAEHDAIIRAAVNTSRSRIHGSERHLLSRTKSVEPSHQRCVQALGYGERRRWNLANCAPRRVLVLRLEHCLRHLFDE